jgi:hypothetical protein
MTRLSAFVRSAPKLFYVVAALDFLKNMLAFAQFYTEGRFAGIDFGMGIGIQLFSVLLSAIVYSATWIAYGVIATILIALYDEVVALRVGGVDTAAAAPLSVNADEAPR